MSLATGCYFFLGHCLQPSFETVVVASVAMFQPAMLDCRRVGESDEPVSIRISPNTRLQECIVKSLGGTISNPWQPSNVVAIGNENLTLINDGNHEGLVTNLFPGMVGTCEQLRSLASSPLAKAGVIFFASAMMSHSCAPNAVR